MILQVASVLRNRICDAKALRYNFSFGNFLSKRLQNLMKVNESSLTKIITSLTSFCKFFNQFFTSLLSFNKTNN